MVRKVSKRNKKKPVKKTVAVPKGKKTKALKSPTSARAPVKKKVLKESIPKKKILKKKTVQKKPIQKQVLNKKPLPKRPKKPTRKIQKALKRASKIKKVTLVKKKVQKKKIAEEKIAPKKKVAKKVIKKTTPQRQAVKKKAVTSMIRKRSTKVTKADDEASTPAEKKPSARAAVKRAVKKAVAKVAAPKTGLKKVIKSVKESTLARSVAKIKRPIPKMKAQSGSLKSGADDVMRMTHPGDIENIISQLSDAADEIHHAESTKFHIGVQHNGGALSEQELPSEYGKDRAVLLVVDPRFVFTYWEVRSDSLAEAARHVGHDGKLTLRFYDVSNATTPEQSHFWDIEIFDRLGNWYLKLAYPEQLLCLDIGIKNNQGHFYRITRSNFVKLPQQSLAKPGPIKWMVVTPSGEKSISDVEEYTDADLVLLKKILGPYFFDLLMRGRLSTIAGSSIEGVFYDVNQLAQGPGPGALPSSISSVTSWTTAR